MCSICSFFAQNMYCFVFFLYRLFTGVFGPVTGPEKRLNVLSKTPKRFV